MSMFTSNVKSDALPMWPKLELRLSGSKFKSTATEQDPSNYLLEVVATRDPRVEVLGATTPYELPTYDSETNPLLQHALTLWPGPTWPGTEQGAGLRQAVACVGALRLLMRMGA